MLTQLKKVAIFLMMIGMAKGQSIIELMDNDEIKAVVGEIGSLTVLSQELQESVLAEFKELGYEDGMKPSEVLFIIRSLLSQIHKSAAFFGGVVP